MDTSRARKFPASRPPGERPTFDTHAELGYEAAAFHLQPGLAMDTVKMLLEIFLHLDRHLNEWAASPEGPGAA